MKTHIDDRRLAHDMIVRFAQRYIVFVDDKKTDSAFAVASTLFKGM